VALTALIVRCDLRKATMRGLRRSPTTSPCKGKTFPLSRLSGGFLRREGPSPHNRRSRPRCSLIRFPGRATERDELLEADVTHWELSGGEHAEILNNDLTITPACF